MAWSDSFDPTDPDGDVGTIDQGDDQFRQLKRNLRERLEWIYAFGASDADENLLGVYRVPFNVNTTNPSAVTDQILLFGKDDTAKAELFAIDEDGDVIQITKGGKGLLDSFRLSNAGYLIGRNAADDGDVKILSVNGSDRIVFDSIPQITDTPSTDNDAARKKYVDDAIAAIPPDVGIGSSVAKTDNTVYQAATDGFFIGIISATSDATFAEINGYTDSSNPPTTLMGVASAYRNDGGYSRAYGVRKQSFCIPVKKNDYYKGVTTYDSGSGGQAPTVTYYFISLGS
jgi:hypothetical protein